MGPSVSLASPRSVSLRWRTQHIVFFVSALWLSALELGMQSHTFDGVHYQKWSSDAMLQTLPIVTLRATPLEALFYLHIQPPMLDSVRAALAQLFARSNAAELVRRVDVCLSVLYIILFGFLSVGVYQWTRRLATRRVALLTWLVWIAYPAGAFYATMMESTFMSTVFIFFFFYELWRLRKADGSIYRLTALTLCLFFTRTIFQWYFFPLAIVLLLLQRAARKHLLVFASLTALFVIPYLVKQKVLFGTLSTTTYAGYFQAGIFWYEPTAEELEREKRKLSYHYPDEANAYQGDKPFNSADTAIDNLVYPKLTYRHCRAQLEECANALATSLSQNMRNYWKPSAAYTPNGLTDNLFCAGRYRIILGLAAAGWALEALGRWASMRVGRRSIMDELAFIFAATMLANRGRWIEADRLKFLLEPVFFVFGATSFYRVCHRHPSHRKQHFSTIEQ
jgi:hypothetical protein